MTSQKRELEIVFTKGKINPKRVKITFESQPSKFLRDIINKSVDIGELPIGCYPFKYLGRRSLTTNSPLKCSMNITPTNLHNNSVGLGRLLFASLITSISSTQSFYIGSIYQESICEETKLFVPLDPIPNQKLSLEQLYIVFPKTIPETIKIEFIFLSTFDKFYDRISNLEESSLFKLKKFDYMIIHGMICSLESLKGYKTLDDFSNL